MNYDPKLVGKNVDWEKLYWCEVWILTFFNKPFLKKYSALRVNVNIKTKFKTK